MVILSSQLPKPKLDHHSPFACQSTSAFKTVRPDRGIKSSLTLSQTTNFRLIKTKEFADDNFKFVEKWQVFQMDGKHWGKRRNGSLKAISPFPPVFSIDLHWINVKAWACLVNGIMALNLTNIFNLGLGLNGAIHRLGEVNPSLVLVKYREKKTNDFRGWN